MHAVRSAVSWAASHGIEPLVNDHHQEADLRPSADLRTSTNAFNLKVSKGCVYDIATNYGVYDSSVLCGSDMAVNVERSRTIS